MSRPKVTVQNMYGRKFKILEGDALQSFLLDLINQGVLAANTAMMCRPFCASGAGNPIVSSHRSPIPGYEWDEVWFGFEDFTSEETFLRKHGFFGSGRCYIQVMYKKERHLIALKDFINYCPDEMLGPALRNFGRGMGRYSKFFINAGRLPHHTHDVKDEAYWIEPTMVVDYDLYDEQCFMAVGLEESFGPNELREYLTVNGWNDPFKILKRHARWELMYPGKAMLMNPRILHGPARLLPHYEPQFLDDGYRMYERMPKIPRWLLTGREIPKELLLQGATVPKMTADDRANLLDYLVSDKALDWAAIHDPLYAAKHTCVPILDTETCDGRDVHDSWIIYGAFASSNDEQVFASKRTVIQPGATWTMNDPVGSDLICTQGVGTFDHHVMCAPRALKPGDLGNWTFIVPFSKARGAKITNTGESEMVLLRTFGMDHPTMPVLHWQDRSILRPKRLAS